MSNASIERRLTKLEGRRRPDGALFFMLWAQSDQDLSRQRAQLSLGPGDTVIAALWPDADEPPPSRWINAGMMEPREVEALVPAIERGAAGTALDQGQARQRPDLVDEILIAIALG